MTVSSVFNEGLAGMQQSHKKMQQAAEQVVRAGIPTDHQRVGATGAAPVTNSGSSVDDLPSVLSVSASTEAGSANSSFATDDIIEPLIQMKQQELMFDASATVVKVASDMIGHLIDDIS